MDNTYSSQKYSIKKAK
ncbi:hypothetical protein [Plasmodium yoelii yoelii]|uniref:Uncharacterized protein n=1 Tax=Plasmodium yoelii yoelii TaxID=73239 RepID=Q7RJ25_PLAYO|nr:hypothetical protein [Plasmodium yoelii yoelii]